MTKKKLPPPEVQHKVLTEDDRAELRGAANVLVSLLTNRPLKNAPLMPAWTPLAFFFVNPTMQSDFNLGLHGLPDPFRG